MKKIKNFLIIGLILSISLFTAGCSLLDLFSGSNNTQSTFELKDSYVISEITEKHLPPCDYEGNHENSIALALMLSAYNGTRIDFERENDNSGTFVLNIDNTSDNVFTVRNGTYTINNNHITLKDGENQMIFKLQEDSVIYSSPETEVTSGEHKGHFAVYSFIFKVLLSK